MMMADSDQAFDDGAELTKMMEAGQDGRTANTAKRAEAHGLVDYWVGKASGAKWPNLDKQKVRAGLHARIDDPDRIDQKTTSLCGVAAFVRELAWDDPCQYGLLGALLYEGGWGNLGKRRLTRIEPGAATRKEQVPRRNGQDMDHADWLVLASVRDAFNATPYVNDAFEGLRGMTVGAMPEYFKAAGYEKLAFNYSATTPKGVKNIEEASAYFRNGYAVALFVHSSMIDQSTRILPTAQHWIVLRSPIQLNYVWKPGRVGVRIDKVWTWGEEKTIPSGYAPYMPLAEFSAHYYGYVAAKASI
jgi:hypothetical protein